MTDNPEDNGIDAELRFFSPQGASLPRWTVVYAYARMFAPLNQYVILDVVRLHPFPGDTSSDESIPWNVDVS